MKSISSLHSQLTVSSFYASSNANGGEDLVNDNERKGLTNELEKKSLVNKKEGENQVSEEEKEEEEEEEGEERGTSENVTHVIFLWHYTSAAVCFSVFIVIIFFMLLFGGKQYYDDHWGDDPGKDTFFVFANYRRFVVVSCLFSLLTVLMTVLPATRMDGFLKGTYWIFFIPYLLLAVFVPIVFVVYYRVVHIKERHGIVYYWHDKDGYSCVPVVMTAAFCLLSLVGLILWILRLDNVLPPSFKYTFVFLFLGLGVSCGIYGLFYTVFVDDDDDHDEALAEWSIVVCVGNSCAIFFAPALLYAGFILPFSLRKDLVFHTSYHFTLIPFYVLSVVILVCLILYACAVGEENGKFHFVVYLILSVLVTGFLVLSFVCLGGASDASERYAEGKAGTSRGSLSSSPSSSSSPPSSLSLPQPQSIRPSSSAEQLQLESSLVAVSTSEAKAGEDLLIGWEGRGGEFKVRQRNL